MEKLRGVLVKTMLGIFIIFGVDNSFSSHADDRKNNFLVLGEGNTFGINACFGAPAKSLALTLIRQRQNFAWVYIIMAYSYLFVNGNEILKFKSDNENVNFLTQFCIGSISNGFDATESKKVSLKRHVIDYSAD